MAASLGTPQETPGTPPNGNLLIGICPTIEVRGSRDDFQVEATLARTPLTLYNGVLASCKPFGLGLSGHSLWSLGL